MLQWDWRMAKSLRIKKNRYKLGRTKEIFGNRPEKNIFLRKSESGQWNFVIIFKSIRKLVVFFFYLSYFCSYWSDWFTSASTNFLWDLPLICLLIFLVPISGNLLWSILNMYPYHSKKFSFYFLYYRFLQLHFPAHSWSYPSLFFQLFYANISSVHGI